MDKRVKKIYYDSIQLPVYAYEKKHRRGVRTPNKYRYGKGWKANTGNSMEFLKLIYNKGLRESDFDFNKGGMQHGFIIY